MSEEKKTGRFELLGVQIGTTKKNNSEVEGLNFLKVLKENRLYRFYQNYEFFNGGIKVENGEKIDKIVQNSHLPVNFYGDADLTINISAIVGKNGSGKSALFEIFYLSIYLLSVCQKMLDFNLYSIEEKKIRVKKEEGEFDHDEHTLSEANEQINQLVELLKKIPKAKLKYYPGLTDLFNGLDNYLKDVSRWGDKTYFDCKREQFENWKKKLLKITETVNWEVFYRIDNCCFGLKIQKDGERFVHFRTITFETDTELVKEDGMARDLKIGEILDSPFDLSKYFFYTVAVSYSQYSLNSLEIGDWVNPLFHKNDGYQTPLVLNPKRHEGNIDINTENDLVRQRLISNVLEPFQGEIEESLRAFTPNKICHQLELKVNWEKIHGLSDTEELDNNFDDCISKLYEEYTGQKYIDVVKLIDKERKQNVELTIHFYLVRKIRKLCLGYDRYKKYKNGGELEVEGLVDEILRDESHITYKIRQVLNFFHYRHIEEFKDNLEKRFLLDIETFSRKIEVIRLAALEGKDNNKMRALRTIDLIPPAFFDCKIKFEEVGYFDDFSSGEKQKVYSVSSILYHLKNISSVVNISDKNHFIKYKYVNVMLDEIELYFHPDMQRTYVADLCRAIKSIKHLLKEIKGVNIIFATHSPFILSDIPSSNVLRLVAGKPENHTSETFGSNIHDLLHDDFFLTNGFSGEYSTELIKQTIRYFAIKINEHRVETEFGDELLPYQNVKKEALIAENEHLKELGIGCDDENFHAAVTKLIGEPVLQLKLNEMYEYVKSFKDAKS